MPNKKEKQEQQGNNVVGYVALAGLIAFAVFGAYKLLSGVCDLIFKVPQQVNTIDHCTQDIHKNTQGLQREHKEQSASLLAIGATTKKIDETTAKNAAQFQELLKQAKESNERAGKILSSTNSIKADTTDIKTDTANIRQQTQEIREKIEPLAKNIVDAIARMEKKQEQKEAETQTEKI